MSLLAARTGTCFFALVLRLEGRDTLTAAPVEELAVTGALVEVVANDGGVTRPHVRLQLAGGIFLPARFIASEKNEDQEQSRQTKISHSQSHVLRHPSNVSNGTTPSQPPQMN